MQWGRGRDNTQTDRRQEEEKERRKEKMSKLGDLEVILVDARGLSGWDAIGKIDPYVMIQYRDQEQKSRIARDAGKNPTWNEKFKFKVHYPFVENAAQHKLVLRIMDRDTFTADDFVGLATINVGDVIAMGVEKGLVEVAPTKYRVVLEDKRYHGEIRVGVSFTMMK